MEKFTSTWSNLDNGAQQGVVACPPRQRLLFLRKEDERKKRCSVESLSRATQEHVPEKFWVLAPQSEADPSANFGPSEGSLGELA
eukprot:scaffold360_cov374-Pavlova_lutheri.AAC.22